MIYVKLSCILNISGLHIQLLSKSYKWQVTASQPTNTIQLNNSCWPSQYVAVCRQRRILTGRTAAAVAMVSAVAVVSAYWHAPVASVSSLHCPPLLLLDSLVALTCNAAMPKHQTKLEKKHSKRANPRRAAIANFVEKQISCQNYFSQIAKSGEDISSHSQAVVSARFLVQPFWPWTLNLTSQKLTVTFDADAEHPCQIRPLQCREPHLASSRSAVWFRRLSYVMLHLGYTICVPWQRRLKCFCSRF